VGKLRTLSGKLCGIIYPSCGDKRDISRRFVNNTDSQVVQAQENDFQGSGKDDVAIARQQTA
jgi:hypothetical protein